MRLFLRMWLWMAVSVEAWIVAIWYTDAMFGTGPPYFWPNLMLTVGVFTHIALSFLLIVTLRWKEVRSALTQGGPRLAKWAVAKMVAIGVLSLVWLSCLIGCIIVASRW